MHTENSSDPRQTHASGVRRWLQVGIGSLLTCVASCAEPAGGGAEPTDKPKDKPPLIGPESETCKTSAEKKSSYGCEFYGLRVDTPYGGGCFAMMVANASDVPAYLSIDRTGKELGVADFTRIPKGQGPSLTLEPYDAELGLPPGEVAILFLSHAPGESGVFAPACPVPPAVPGDAPILGTRRGNAFRLSSDAPVSAYQMFPYGGGSAAMTAATLLLPTHVWDTDYIAVNAYPAADNTSPPTLAIVGREANTRVTLIPNVDVLDGIPVDGKFLQGTPSGISKTYTLGLGEYLQFSQIEELTGSRIQSDKPVGLLGGSTCMNVPTTTCCCDAAQQQIPPIAAMGREYVGVRHRDRNGMAESVPWRIVGAANDTQLVYEPATPKDAPTTLSQGQVVEFSTSDPFVVRSQDSSHPFYLATYMTGGATDGIGDAEWVNVTPKDQYLNSYVFFTDPTYPETNLVLVRAKNSDGVFSEVELECAGTTVSGWKAVGDYEYAWVNLVTGDFKSVSGCSNGSQRMQSTGPFGVTVWGWGSAATGGQYPAPNFTRWVSYAYPAAAGVKKISEVPR